MSHYINGQWVKGKDKYFESQCPATGKMIWKGTEASTENVAEAVNAAKKAQKAWASETLSSRIETLSRYKSILEEEKEALAKAISMDAGKPLWESKTEVAGMIGKLAASIDSFNTRTGDKNHMTDMLETRLTHRPHGVVAVLGPYNFPGHLPNGQLVPALLAGNTVVFKPSELTPLVGEKLISCFEKANFPTGVVNLVQGGKETGQALLKEPVDGVFFTGSYQTGRQIHKHFAGRPEVILALEMGGNNPLIVDEVKSLDAAVFNTIMSAYITSGQRCTCARRLLVPNSQFGDAYLAKLIEKTKQLRVGSYFETPEPFMGAVISQTVAKQLLEKQDELISLGGEALLRMESKGQAILTPGLISVDSVSEMSDEEIFGPLLTVYRYDEINDAVQKANNTRFGLSAGILTENKEHADYFYQTIRAGIVNINRQLTGASGTAPFGGIGRSGNHRPAAFYASDFCAYPMASMVSEAPFMPDNLPIGM